MPARPNVAGVTPVSDQFMYIIIIISVFQPTETIAERDIPEPSKKA